MKSHNFNYFLNILSVTSALGFFVPQVYAETILDPATKKTKKPAVIEKSVEAKASSYTAINEKELKDSGQSTVTQVLSQVPGITTSPSFASFRIRGIANMNTSQYTYGRQGNYCMAKRWLFIQPNNAYAHEQWLVGCKKCYRIERSTTHCHICPPH